eukprot:9467639-Pyramimonas_sp.AAC.1
MPAVRALHLKERYAHASRSCTALKGTLCACQPFVYCTQRNAMRMSAAHALHSKERYAHASRSRTALKGTLCACQPLFSPTA